MDESKIYDLWAAKYVGAGYWVRRVAPGKKGCKDKGWQQQVAEIPASAPYEGIALMGGSPMEDGTTFGWIDVDRDDLVEAFRALLHPKCERIGSKGTSIPVRVEGNVLNAKFRMKDDKKPAVEMLFHQSICVIPPTIHESTKKPYRWVTNELLKVKAADLPLIDSQTAELIKALIENEHVGVLLSGEGTHSAGASLCAKLVHHCDNDRLIENVVRALFPPDYKGDSLKELPGWVKGARKKVDSGQWDKRDNSFLRAKSGAITVCEKNTRIALEKMEVTTRYDEFADRELITIGDARETPVTDNIECTLRSRMDLEYGYRVAPNTFRDTMRALAMERTFHPVKEYLAGLKWDGEERIDEWLIKCGGADDTPYVRAVSTLMLVAACRRIMRPGAKFDEMPVLKSAKQGTFKSTALNVMAVKDDWFCDNFSLDQDSKTLLELTTGKWIIEISELKGLSRGAADHVKSILSRRHDRSRLAYGRITEERPRQFVFVGTTNETEFLRDETGNRRFWPVEIKLIDITRLKAIRDQLWAEAYFKERQGMSLMMDPTLVEEATHVQNVHRVRDNPYVDALRAKIGDKENGRITSSDLLEMLDMEVGKVSNAQYKTLKSAMMELGWEYKPSLKIRGKVTGGYIKGTGADIVQMSNSRGTENGSKGSENKSKPIEY